MRCTNQQGMVRAGVRARTVKIFDFGLRSHKVGPLFERLRFLLTSFTASAYSWTKTSTERQNSTVRRLHPRTRASYVRAVGPGSNWLTQPSQLRTCSGFFAMNFIAKLCVPF